MHIYRQQIHFNLISVWSDMMSLKSDQLAVGLSIDYFNQA